MRISTVGVATTIAALDVKALEPPDASGGWVARGGWWENRTPFFRFAFSLQANALNTHTLVTLLSASQHCV